MKKSLLGDIVTFLFLNADSVFSQTMLKEISLGQQINKSTLVIEGKVVSKRSFWQNSLIYTANTVEVYKVFKGEPIATVEVITQGGVIGSKNQLVFPSLKLNKGDIGVFTLFDNDKSLSTFSKSKTKQFKVYSSLQGFYKYNLKSDFVVNPFSKSKGVTSVFYNKIAGFTKSKYIEMSVIDVNLLHLKLSQNNKVLAPSISNFTPPTVTAGTKRVLTINGSGFGATKGKVGFANADDGGSTFVEALDSQVLSWVDNIITVEVPAEAGTGAIQVTDASSGSIESSTDLTVTFSQINAIASIDLGSGPVDYAYPVRLLDSDGSGGYEWHMETNFNSNIPAKSSFSQALDTWRCETGVNWTFGAVTSTDATADDGVNVIRFDIGNELPDGVLGRCTYYIDGCGSTLANYSVFSYELDIVFDDAENWYYGSGLPGFTQYDFQSVALHELGHGHQLGHVIDLSSHTDNNGDIMYYAISNSEQQRVLHPDNITAGNYVQTINESSVPAFNCYSGTSAMTAYVCNLSVDDVAFNDAIKLYPNPSKGEFYISNKLQINLTKAVVYDLSGRMISEFNISGASRTNTINLIGVSKGIYLLNIHSENAFVTKKIVLE